MTNMGAPHNGAMFRPDLIDTNKFFNSEYKNPVNEIVSTVHIADISN